MKIEIGMFVRTKDGIVAKCDEIIKEFDISFDRDVFKAFDNHNPDCMEIPWKYINEYIKKYSFNIIDVIEIGDYVNGKQVIQKYKDWLDLDDDTADLKDIKNIVTKEQFDACKYVVERDK